MNKTNLSKEQQQFQYLKEVHSLLSNEMVALQADHQRQQLELNYLRAFVRWKNLDEEYNYFAQNAHEAWDDDLPFSYLTL